nr:uncharacterized protein LOC127329179 [Lolium perenne]
MRSVKHRRFSNPPGFAQNPSIRPVFGNTALDPWIVSRARRGTHLSPSSFRDNGGAGGDSNGRDGFLRPGALAQLRDSKIVARSLRSATRVLPPSSPPPSCPPRRGAMPRYPLRKKPPRPGATPPPMSTGAAEAFLGAFALAPSELLAAHD